CLTDYPGNAIQFGTLNANIPLNQEVYIKRALRRYVLGGDGTFDLFGKSWRWDSYLQHGESGSGVKIENEALSNRYNLAMDAIQLPNAQIVCRNTSARGFGGVAANNLRVGKLNGIHRKIVSIAQGLIFDLDAAAAFAVLQIAVPAPALAEQVKCPVSAKHVSAQGAFDIYFLIEGNIGIERSELDRIAGIVGKA